MFGRRSKTIWWFEPRWSYLCPFLLQSSQSFNKKACLRILLVCGAITAAVAIWLQIALPNLQFNWPVNLLKAFAGFIAYIGMFLIIYIAIPPFVSIHKKGIQIQHGQGVRLYKHEDIQAARLVMHRDGKVWLWWTTEKQSRRVGVSSKVHLADIERHLGGKLSVAKC
jgi:hypothetical protein